MRFHSQKRGLLGRLKQQKTCLELNFKYHMSHRPKTAAATSRETAKDMSSLLLIIYTVYR